jgi:hypothetical protein
MKRMNMVIAALFFISSASSQSKDELAIRNILNQQSIAWSSGDKESFMQPYWHNDSLMFIGRSGVTYGWQKTLENYKKNYPDAAAMGKLDFTIINIKRLSPLYYSIVGKWHLARTIGDLNGYFTLLFKKINNSWMIISDHSS